MDFDVAGTLNSLMAVTLEIEEKEEDWFADDWGSKTIQQKIVRKMIETEDSSRLEYPKNMEGAYVIFNKNEKNSWGSTRGVSR